MLERAILAFIASGAIVLALTPLLKRLAMRTTAVARPAQDRWHTRSTPLLGGIGMWIATVAVTFALTGTSSWPSLLPLLLAATGACVLGVVDDLIQIKPATKLTGQIVIGCGAVVLGVGATWSGSPTLDALLTLAWLVAIANAFNLLDNMDGLCAGVAAIGAAFVALSLSGSWSPALIYAAALAGACVGFLVFNFHPASIFMGDSGSLFIGTSLGMLALSETRVGHPSGFLAALAVPVLLLLIPIFDVIFVTLSRRLSARPATTGGRDHTSHRLVAMGFSERQAVLLLYTLAATGGAAAMALDKAQVREGQMLAGLLTVGLALLAVHMARVRVYDGADFVRLRDRAFTPLLIEFTHKRRIFEVLLDLALIVLAYYGAYVIRFDRDLPQYHALFLNSLPIVICCQLISFFAVGVYRGVWHYFTSTDLFTFVKAVVLGAVTSILSLLYLYRFVGYSRSVFLIDAMALLLLMAASRYSFRLVSDLAARGRPGKYRVIVYGAGEAGALLVGEVQKNPRFDYHVIGFIDDDPSKAGKRLAGLPVLGGIDEVADAIARHGVDLVVVSTAKLAPTRMHDLQSVCFVSGTGVLQFEFALRPVPLSPGQRQS